MKQFILLVLTVVLTFTTTLSTSTTLETCVFYEYLEECHQEETFNYKSYEYKMAVLESSDSYKALNRFGYMGRYQFGKSTLKGLRRSGYLKISNKEMRTKNFLNNPELQDRAMLALTNHNTQVLDNYGLMQYIGKEVGGVKITLQGMLAASHLLGPYAVKRFIKTDGRVNKHDGNGTTAKDYMQKFI